MRTIDLPEKIISKQSIVEAILLDAGFAANTTPRRVVNVIDDTTIFPPGHVIQVVTDTFSLGYVTSANPSTTPNSTSGYSLFSTDFTPKSTTSKILIQTSSVSIHEQINGGDTTWLMAFHNTTLIGGSSGNVKYSSFLGALNAGTHVLNHTVNSWGKTLHQINVRAGINRGTAHINGNGYSNLSSGYSEIGLTITEIEGI